MQNTETLIKQLEARRDGGSSKRFIEVFGRLVRAYLEYRRWMKMMVEESGQYRGARTEEELHNLCLRDLGLIKSIQEKGLKSPIRVFDEKECGIEIDGYHRLVILRELGEKEIPSV